MGTSESRARSTAGARRIEGTLIKKNKAAMDHHALIFGADDEFLGAVVPFVTEGLQRREPVVVLGVGAPVELLRRALGRDSDAVTFLDPELPPGSTASALARCRRLFDRYLDGGATRLRMITHADPAATGTDASSWTRYEGIVNSAFGADPVSMVCCYDTRALPKELVDQAAWTHPVIHTGGGSTTNEAYRDPAEVIRSLGPSFPGPPERLVFDVGIEPGGSLPRPQVRRAARPVLGAVRTDDLVLALSEVATNALVHGGGGVRARLWVGPDAVSAQICDRGPGVSDPLLGYVPPRRDRRLEVGGLGLWVTRQLCDTVEFERTRRGFCVRVVVRR